MKHIIEHFRKADPVLFLLAQIIPLQKLAPSNDYFVSLVEDIIGQQLSEKAGRSIFQKVVKLFPESKVTAQSLLKIPDQIIRNAGPSWSKVSFLKDLSLRVLEKKLDFSRIEVLSNDEVARELTMVKGIGPWTVEMFLMFSLGREDVFSHGDAGLRRAIRKVYKLKKDPTRGWVEKLTRKWSPYRTYACVLLWRSLDVA